MVTVSDQEFAKMVADGVDAVPARFASKMQNIAITWDYEPTRWQKLKIKLKYPYLLLGLYEGIPKTSRGNYYSMVLPDKVTIFKKPLESASKDKIELAQKVKHTVWHEIAHHFGLSDAEIKLREKT